MTREKTQAELIYYHTLEIEKHARARDSLMGNDPASDMALQSACEAIPALWSARSWKELEATLRSSADMVRNRWRPQASNMEAVKAHAKLKQGIRIPHLWNAPEGRYFRRVAPILISAKSGVGKSTCARNIIIHNLSDKIPTVYLTNEDTKAEAVIGLFTIWARINSGNIYEFEQVETWLRSAESGGDKFKKEAAMVYAFAQKLEKLVQIVECHDMPMSQILLEAQRVENLFGFKAECTILDYIQKVSHEEWARREPIRIQNIIASKMFTSYVGVSGGVGIAVSQENKEGGTAESAQFERDAGQWFSIERKTDDTTGEMSNDAVIRIKKGRRTGTGLIKCYFEGRSGALIPRETWRPETQPRLGGME